MHVMGSSANLIDTGQFFQSAIILLAAAGIIIPAFARIRISPVIGFILIGVLVGPHGLVMLRDHAPALAYVTIADPALIAPLAKAGIILLLFGIGLELSLNRLWMMRRIVFGLGPAELLGCGAIIALGLLLFGASVQSALILGIALALSSTAIVVPIAGTQSSVGKMAFGMLLFEDVSLVPILLGLGIVGSLAAPDTGALLMDALKGFAILLALIGAGALALPHLFAQAARTRSPEIFLAISLLVIIAGAALGGWIGIGAGIGGLIAGLLIAETPYHEEVGHSIAPIQGLALGVFLVSVGMALDLDMIARNWALLLGALAAILMVKIMVTGALLRWSGARPGVAAETSLLMSSPSETTLIVLAAAAGAGLISQTDRIFWEIVAAMGMTLTPILARIGHDVARRIEWRASQKQGDPFAELPASEAAHPTQIIGYGRVGQMVADMLERHGKPWRAIELNVDAVTAARRHGKPVSFGNVAKPHVIRQLQLDRAAAVVITMNDAAQQLRLTRLIRRDYPDLAIICRARDADHAAALYRAGASDAVPETFESSLQLSEAVLVDLGLAMGPVIASVHERRDEMRREIMAKGGLAEPPKLATSKAGESTQP